jgi:hypothetical protein
MSDLDGDKKCAGPSEEEPKSRPRTLIAGTPQQDGSFLTPDERRLLGNPNDAPHYSQRNRFTWYPGDLQIVSPKNSQSGLASERLLKADDENNEGDMFTTFIDDEEGYLDWVEKHTGGFVVNSFRPPSHKYLRLHRSSCGYIKSPLRTNYTRDYSKTCSDSEQELHEWAVNVIGGVLNPCRCCKVSVK